MYSYFSILQGCSSAVYENDTNMMGNSWLLYTLLARLPDGRLPVHDQPYCQTCIKQPPFGEATYGLTRQVIS